MFDTNHLPDSFGEGSVSVFRLPTNVTNVEWHTWTKPRGKTMLQILNLGGGAGGGAGFGAAAGNARGGGGSGGSAAYSVHTIPLILLPDRLYIQVGSGGAGVASGTAGNGMLSYVSVAPDTNANNLVSVSGSSSPTGGVSGTGGAAGTSGGSGGVASSSACVLSGAGVRQFSAGTAGVNGGAPSGGAGTSVSLPAGMICMPGSGGGGTTSADFAGGGVNFSGQALLSQWAPVNAAAGSFQGTNGFFLWKPFFSFGGMGGGASNTGLGGSGGAGGPGSGGGGGGGGTTGGRGGDGGHGFVMLVCW